MTTTSDELVGVDQAFSGNRLLATFPDEARALIEPHGESVELASGETLFRRGRDVEASHFPCDETMVSLIVDLSGGRSVEVASIGREGAVGGIVSCGNAPAFTRAEVMVPGPALRVSMEAIENAKRRSTFVADLFCRYSDYLLAQVMQSVACNAFHPIQERAARWLLHAQDRAGDRLRLTQEALAGLLGVQRTTVNAVVQLLEQDGLIESRRGAVRIADRAGLMRRSCPCYAALEKHFADVIGNTGGGRG